MNYIRASILVSAVFFVGLFFDIEPANAKSNVELNG